MIIVRCVTLHIMCCLNYFFVTIVTENQARRTEHGRKPHAGLEKAGPVTWTGGEGGEVMEYIEKQWEQGWGGVYAHSSEFTHVRNNGVKRIRWMQVPGCSHLVSWLKLSLCTVNLIAYHILSPVSFYRFIRNKMSASYSVGQESVTMELVRNLSPIKIGLFIKKGTFRTKGKRSGITLSRHF